MDERSIICYGHLSPRKRSNKGENPNDNGLGKHGESGEEVIEEKCCRVKYIRKQIIRELEDKMKLSMT